MAPLRTGSASGSSWENVKRETIADTITQNAANTTRKDSVNWVADAVAYTIHPSNKRLKTTNRREHWNLKPCQVLIPVENPLTHAAAIKAVIARAIVVDAGDAVVIATAPQAVHEF